jgi:hypothetical protein
MGTMPDKLHRLIGRYGIAGTTAFAIGLTVMASVILTYTILIGLMTAPRVDVGITLAVLCPLVITPPIFYVVLKLIEQLNLSNSELQTALEEVKVLSGLLPICASCKKIRDDQGYWQQIENYISYHTDAEFTHSHCPDCIEKLYGDILRKSNENRDESNHGD